MMHGANFTYFYITYYYIDGIVVQKWFILFSIVTD